MSANLVLKNIHIENFMSVKDIKLDLQNLGTVKVLGKNLSENKASSNGSGKSAVVTESILFALTGATNKESKNLSNIFVPGGVARVTLDFVFNGHKFNLVRTDGDSKSLTISKDGKDISGNTYTKSKDILDQELGFVNKDIVSSIIVLGQNLNGKFSSLRPSERKSRLEYLVGVDTLLQNIQGLLDASEKEINAQLNTLNKKQTEYSTIISSNSEIIDKYKNLPKLDEKEYKIKTEERKSKAIEYNQIKDNIEATKTEVNKILLSKDPLNSQLLENNNEINKLQNEITDKENKIKLKEKDIKSIDDKLNDLKEQKKSIDKNECPTCHQHLQDNELEAHLKDETVKLEAEKDKLNSELKKLSQNSNTEVITKISELNKKNTEINNKISEIQKQTSGLSKEINDNTIKAQSIYTEIQKLDEYIKSYNKQKVENDSIDGVIDTANKNIESARASLKELDKSLKKYNHDKEIHKYFKNATSRKFRNFLLDGVFNYLNKKLAISSKELFDKYVIKLENNGNNIDVRLGDKYFEDLSGGEQRKVDIAIQLALRSLAKEQRGFSSSLITLDEICDGCDSSAIEILLKFIYSELTDVSSIFITSHMENIVFNYDKILEITKGIDEITTAKFVS